MSSPASPAAQASLFSGFLAVVVGSVFLAFGPLFVRLSGVDPIAAAFWRMLLAAPLLWLLAKRFEAQRATSARMPLAPADANLKPIVLKPILLAAAFFAADLAVWHLGIVRTSLANAALLSNITSLLLAAYALLVLKERPHPKVALALLLALLGVSLLGFTSAQKGGGPLAGDLLSLLAAVFYTAYLLVLAQQRARFAALTLLAWVTPYTALFLLPMALAAPGAFLPTSWQGLAALAGLAVGSQVIGQGLVIKGIGQTSPLLAGLALLVQPVIAGVLGWLFYAEALGFIEFLGAFILLLSLILARLAPPAQR
jgi:drug/metabolite transporter (DMT)-like permease